MDNEPEEQIVGNIQTTIFTDDDNGFQAKKFFLTYHIKGDESFEIAFKRLEKLADLCDKYIFGEEYGKSGKTPHIQGAFILKNKMRASTLQKHFFLNGVTLRKLKNWNCALTYCQKEGNNIMTNQTITVLKPLPCEKWDEMKDWQKGLDLLVQGGDKTPNHDRAIYWYYSEKGCTGKTTFARYLHRKYGFIALSGKAADMKHAIIEYTKTNGNTPNGIVVNIPRSVDAGFISYTGFEEIKDMFFFSGKYEGGMVDGNPPFLIIFSNEMPNMNKMSEDRWCIRNIECPEDVIHELEAENYPEFLLAEYNDPDGEFNEDHIPDDW